MASSATGPDTLVTLKVNIDGSNRRFKLPLRDLGASTLPIKLRTLLGIPPSSDVVFERYSDSAAAFVTLDPDNTSVYKQLYRAAKAKLKLRLKVSVKDIETGTPRQATVEDEAPTLAEEQVDSHRYPSPPASPLMGPATDTLKEAVSTPPVAEVHRGFEDLLLNRALLCSFPSRQATNYLSNTGIPVPRGPVAHEKLFADIATASNEEQAATSNSNEPACVSLGSQCSSYSVYCNHCNHAIPDEHYHCGTCDDGDYDLCQECIDRGVLCGGEGHWMIKRSVMNGKIVNSTTETLPPRVPQSESKTTLVAPIEETKARIATRTCNSCIQKYSEDSFVTCTTCDDFDLCIPCHVNCQHGHNPKHAFAAAVEEMDLEPLAQVLLEPGRNTSHNAICDGCDKYIFGVRYKCLDCPDWDYCATCVVNASFIHPRHRFVPIYEPISEIHATHFSKVRHHGIYCDGPLCGEKSSYITGDRYKCAVCHDTDFCASCEASPSNLHNKTHPLIKFKTPVRNVSVTTMGDHDNGQPMPIMGDRRGRTMSKSTETTPTQSANAATQVQTVADLQPSESVKEEAAPKSEVEPADVKLGDTPAATAEDLAAIFVHDAVPDGSVLPPNSVFEQTWVLRNGGAKPWPAGCTVKFVGGDNMCANDPDHPASVHELVSAAESTTCYSEVAPGQEFGFTVLMRTPNRPGKVISYWRLTGPTGNKFGHRLWCDVMVGEPSPAIEEPAPVIKEEIEDQRELKDVEDHPIQQFEKSQMIFPKLEKESPIASVHQEVTVGQSQPEADDFEELIEEGGDIEDDETEDDFLTDEEYDILDASDEEYLAEQSKAAKK